MRIIAGSRKGTRLEAPPGNDVRPTSDKLRGALLSILGGMLPGGEVLDLCAGTGAVALECLSRGATRAVVVENDKTALAMLRHNAQHTRLDAQVDVLPVDVVVALQRLAKNGQHFDIVYFDPPYDSQLYAPVLAALPVVLAPGADVFVESRHGLPDDLLVGWSLVMRRRYGGGWLDRLSRPLDVESP